MVIVVPITVVLCWLICVLLKRMHLEKKSGFRGEVYTRLEASRERNNFPRGLKPMSKAV